MLEEIYIVNGSLHFQTKLYHSVYYFVTVLYMPRSASDPSTDLHLMMWENLHY